MSRNRRYDDQEEEEDYEEGENESEINNSEMDEKLNEAEQYKSMGNKHMASMEYNKAYNAYSTALKLCPLGPYSHVYLSNRAAALLSLKRYSAAIIDSRRAIALAPTFGKGHARLGQSLYFLKDYAGAIEAYQNALHYEPDNQVTMIYLNKAKRKLERSEEKMKRTESTDATDAVSVAESHVTFSPEPEERDRSASILTRKTNIGIEESLYSAIENKYPTSDYSTSNFYPNDQPSLSYATKNTNIIMDEAPYDESSRFNRGTIQWASNQSHRSEKGAPSTYKLKDEEDEDEEDNDLDPDFDEALKLLERASAKLSKKQYRTAVDLYSAALFLVPDDFNLTPHLFVGRANALNGLRRHEGAFNDCKMALSHNSDSAEAHTTMARSLFYLKDYRGAIESFDKAISVLAYGEFLSSLDELYYEKAVELSKDQPAENQVDDDAASAVSSSYYSVRTMGTSKPVPKLNPPRFVSRSEALNSSPVVPSLPKHWADKVPPSLVSISVGPERDVVFLTEGLGVKLNRGPDGIIRVLYVSDQNAGDSGVMRKGDISVGDVVREAVGLDLRRPVTKVMWADTVALIKMADRPITFVVAAELSQPPPTVIEEIARISIAEGDSPKIRLSNKAFLNRKKRYDSHPMNPSFANGIEPVKSKSKKKQSSEEQKSQSETADGTFAVDHALAQATAVFADVFQSADHFDLLDKPSRISPKVAQSSGDKSLIDNVPACTDTSNDVESTNYDDGDAPVDPPDVISSTPEVVSLQVIKNDKVKVGKKERKIPIIKLPKWNLAQAGTVLNLNPISQATSVLVDVFQTNDKTGERSFSDFNEEKEILFPSALISQGWDNQSWKAADLSRKLIFSGIIRRWMKGNNDLWSDDPTSVFTMALFADPNVILLMRLPKSVTEVRTLLNLPPDGEPIGKTLDSFMIADSVIDLKTCKLKLSKITTATSLCEDNRRSSFFEIITPKETFVITAKSSNTASNADILISTSEWERNISEALFRTHEQDNSEHRVGWRHNLVIGSLHSYIAHKKNNFLQKAISSAADTSIVDGFDEDGLTPLLFACLQRNSEAASILLSLGADCSVMHAGKTPYHICAEQLDDQTLSVLLSVGRSQPNILDDFGRTPMYVAIVEGKNVTGSSDIQLLKRCLFLLESRGGLIIAQNPEFNLPHPIPYLASIWRGSVLAVVFSHCSYRYSSNITFNGSLSSVYQYPLHICLLTLRDRIAGLNRKGRKREKTVRPDDEDFISTVQVLLDHGFEPNERIEYLHRDSVYAEELEEIIGFSPIQVLAAASLEINDLGRMGLVKQSVQESVEELISKIAEILICHGARINLEIPPITRPQRSVPSSSNISSLLSTENQLPKVDRSIMKLDKNKAVLEAFASDEDLKDNIILWLEEKCVDATDRIELVEKEVTNVLDSKGPGGSDSTSCAICWKQFKKGLIGSGSKKKSICVLSKCYLCDECCSKTLQRNGLSYKISDGQFNLARKDVTRQADEDREAENERIRQQKLRTEMARRATEREKQDDLFGGAFDTVKGFFSDNVKDIKDLTDNFKIQVDGDDIEADEEYVGLGSNLAGTRDAFYERGERLNILRDKSEALKDAGHEYLRLATELRKQQESRGGFFSRKSSRKEM